MEESTMASRKIDVARYCGLLAAGLFVAWGLYSAQFRGYYGIDADAWFDPLTSFTDSKYGWPVFFVTRSETYDMVAPRFVLHVSNEVGHYALTADIALWLAMMAATVYISRKALWSGWRFNLSSLFAVTTAAAVMLAWWRVERANWVVIPLLQAEVGAPLLRLLDYSPFVYVPVLFGAGCLVMCAILMASAAARFAIRMMRRSP
jgi:hypothetical protein